MNHSFNTLNSITYNIISKKLNGLNLCNKKELNSSFLKINPVINLLSLITECF